MEKTRKGNERSLARLDGIDIAFLVMYMEEKMTLAVVWRLEFALETYSRSFKHSLPS